MPIGVRTPGNASGPMVGPRYVDPAAAAFAPGAIGPPPAALASPPPAVPAELTSDSVSRSPWTNPTRLLGWSLAAVGGAAVIDVRDGTDTGNLLAVIGLAAGETNREWFGPDGIQVNTGIRVVAVSGSTRGVFWHRPPEVP